MHAAIDVHYRDPEATAAGVLFRDWTDALPAREITTLVSNVQPYQSGAFYRRELPCILQVLALVAEPLETIVVDGYVWLSDPADSAGAKPGLGAHFYEALKHTTPIIGVAKTPMRGAVPLEVFRGTAATKPLYVTAAGVTAAEAADRIRRMHGSSRIPDLLRRVDELSRAP
jgi:deoxyribonuclease V